MRAYIVTAKIDGEEKYFTSQNGLTDNLFMAQFHSEKVRAHDYLQWQDSVAWNNKPKFAIAEVDLHIV